MQYENIKSSSWVKLNWEYSIGQKRLQAKKEELRNKIDIQSIADRENIGNMINETGEILKELKVRMIYEFNSLSNEEILILTEQEREIASLRQTFTYRQIEEKTGIPRSTVYEIYKRSINKVVKWRKSLNKEPKESQEKNQVSVKLSKQQIKIQELHKKGKNNKDIANILNTSEGNVRKQLSIAKKKCYQNNTLKSGQKGGGFIYLKINQGGTAN